MLENTVIGYAPSCGYLHGQITGAYIDYSENRNLEANMNSYYVNTSLMKKSSALESLEAFDFDSYLNSDISDHDDLYNGLDGEDVFAMDNSDQSEHDDDDQNGNAPGDNTEDAVNEESEIIYDNESDNSGKNEASEGELSSETKETGE